MGPTPLTPSVISFSHLAIVFLLVALEGALGSIKYPHIWTLGHLQINRERVITLPTFA